MTAQDNIHDGIIELRISSKLFSKETVLKTLYWFGDKFLIDISTIEDDFLVTLMMTLSITCKRCSVT